MKKHRFLAFDRDKDLRLTKYTYTKVDGTIPLLFVHTHVYIGSINIMFYAFDTGRRRVKRQ
jgi:hypothetical protein